ncbi:MAG: L-histidine N(alpha)-methyltransferase [Pseudonocardiales bacterium]|nr:L-histidine N(alpha)-methyltransferase [Pseudonocardiales bacterium]MBV9652428.1 L-histidine N(alpha)-methyltransferase [Pseudonocardiales bacterium]
MTRREPNVTILRLGDSSSLADGRDLRDGLHGIPRRIPSHYGYDRRGSELFDAITRLPEYFLAHVETELLKQYSHDIMSITGTRTLIELGSGSARKTRHLLDSLKSSDRPTFYPVDISEEMLRVSAHRLFADFNFSIHAIAAPWDQGLRWLRENVTDAYTTTFLGSGIGNMDPVERGEFLNMVTRSLKTGDKFLLTADLHKTVAEFERAYVDPPGQSLWGNFRINRLAHINRLFDANFDLTRYYDASIYNADTNTVEAGLYSTSQQNIAIPKLGISFTLKKNERIIVDYAVKFDRDEIKNEVESYGFSLLKEWVHGPRQYGVFAFVKC